VRFALTLALTVAALVGLAARLVSQRHVGVQLGYDIGRATTEQRRLEEEVKRLRIDRAALLDPARLEPVALKYGYKTPGTDDVVAVPPLEALNDGPR
jgi:cell division protein FtsL